VHFTPGLEETARRAGGFAEEAYAILSERLLPPPRGRIHLLVTDHVDFANGWASPFPRNRIGLYAVPPVSDEELGFYDDWMQLLILHELVHIFHLDHAGGIWRPLRGVFGRVPLFFPNAFTPGWFLEGLAVHYESELTRAGRVRGSRHEMVLRTALLEDAFFTIDRATGAPATWPGPASRYTYGSLFVHHLARTHGEEAMQAFVRGVGRQLLPFAFELPARRVYGANFTTLWREWADSLRAHYEAEATALSAAGLTQPEQLTVEGRYSAVPRYDPQGRLVYMSASGRAQAQLRFVESPGVTHPLAPLNNIDVMAWEPDGALLLSQLEFEGAHRIHADLYRWREGEGMRRLTRGARLTEPSPHPAGGPVAAVQLMEGTNVPVLFDEATGAVRRLAEPSAAVSWSMPRWSPDGSSIAIIRWRIGGFRDVMLLDPTATEARLLVADRGVDASPAWSPDGRYVVFNSDRTGIFNLFAYDLEEERLWQVTSVLTGAFSPEVSPDGAWIAFSHYGSDGYAIARVPFDPSLWRPAAPLRAAVDIPVEVSDPELPEGPARRYSAFPSILPTLWIPLGGSDVGRGFGAMTQGSDVVGRHRWSIDASWLSGGRAHGGLWWEYSGLGRPVVELSAEQRWRVASPAFVGAAGDTTAILGRERAVSLFAFSLHPRLRRTFWTGLGADAAREEYVFEHPERAPGQSFIRRPVNYGISLLAGYTSARIFAFSISPEQGVSLSGSVQARSRGLTLDPDSVYGRGVGRVAGYLPLDVGGFARHVAAARVAGGYAGGADPAAFTVGGVSGTPGPLALGMAVETTQRTFPVRGIRAGAQRGNRAVGGSAEYRFPLLLVERGFRTAPVFLDRLSGSVFSDAAAAWCTPRRENECQLLQAPLTAPDPLVTAGAEISASLTLGFNIGMVMRAGVGVPLRAPGISAGREFYLALGRSF
jgi:hypothetical protein